MAVFPSLRGLPLNATTFMINAIMRYCYNAIMSKFDIATMRKCLIVCMFK